MLPTRFLRSQNCTWSEFIRSFLLILNIVACFIGKVFAIIIVCDGINYRFSKIKLIVIWTKLSIVPQILFVS